MPGEQAVGERVAAADPFHQAQVADPVQESRDDQRVTGRQAAALVGADLVRDAPPPSALQNTSALRPRVRPLRLLEFLKIGATTALTQGASETASRTNATLADVSPFRMLDDKGKKC